jgi:NTE family protein
MLNSISRVVTLAACILLFVTASPARADDHPASEESAERPRIGLVLGGGGARGAAHIGVLKVLEELQIPVDYVAGTSMGSIVGGLFASGMSPEEIEREVLAMDWDDLFHDDPAREELSFRRKRDDDLYAFAAKPGFNDGKVEMPLAFIRGQKLDLVLNRLTLPLISVTDFDDLPIPYRAVATDIENGKEVVLGSGSLAKAIRASMAVPAAFDPVDLDGRLLVDGGLANNVPVSVARDMGADVLIVVNVGSGLLSREQITSALAVTGQLANFLFSLNTEHQLKTLDSDDVLITPDLGDIGGGSFDRAAETIAPGEAAAREVTDALRRYSVSNDEYARFVARRSQRRPGAPVIDSVRVDNRSPLSDAVIAERISATPGEPLDLPQLEQDIGRVYGLEVFESVRYDLLREDEQTSLVIGATAKHWGPGFVQGGLASSNNMQGDSTLRLGLVYTRTLLNSLNGEWRLGGQLGDDAGVFTEIHQPLDASSRYFVAGGVGYFSRNVNVFDSAGDNLARYRLSTYGLQLSAGREFGNWGEGRVGYRRLTGDAEITVGDPAPKLDVDRGEVFVRLSADELDNLYFPRSGYFSKLEWTAARESLGSGTDYDQVLLGFQKPFSWGRNTLIGGFVGATTLDDDAPLEALFRIGGLFRLSGLQEEQLTGQHAGLAMAVYMRELQRSSIFKTYFGGSLELGNVWQNSSDIDLDNTIFAGSLFLAMDTPIGPIYLAYGHADTSDSSLYIYVGPRIVF